MLKRFLPYSLAVLLISAVVLAGCGGGNAPTSTPTPADNDLINELLDQYQYGLKNKNPELVASLCAFPFIDFFSSGETHETADKMIDSYKTMFAYSIESIEILEISPRIIMIDGDNAIIDGYYHFKIISISQTTEEHTNPIELSVVKDNGTWKISAIKASYNIEKYKINSLLNQYQIAMKNMEVATLVSLCTFPFDDEGTSYNDANAMETAYQDRFSQIESISIYEIINRDIDIISNESSYGAIVHASIHLKEKFKIGSTLDYTYSCLIHLRNFNGLCNNGLWKIYSVVRMP